MPRHRERSTDSQSTAVYHRQYADGSFKQSSVTLGYEAQRTDETSDDVEQPAWRRLIAKGHWVNHPCVITWHRQKGNAVSWSNFLGPSYIGTVAQEQTGFHTFGELPAARVLQSVSLLGPIEYDETSIINQAVVKGANPRQFQAQILVMAAEGRQTYSLITDAAAKVRDIMRTIRGVQRRRIGVRRRDVLVSLSNFELQLRYGLRATVYDLQKTLRSYRKAAKSGQSFRFRTSAHIERSFTDTVPFSTLGGFNGSIRVSGSRSLVYTAKADSYFYWKWVRDSQFLKKMESLGFGNIFESLWEVTRLSFVADWFVNVRDVINAHAPNLTTKLIGSGVTLRTDLQRTISGSAAAEPGYSTQFDAQFHTCTSGAAELLDHRKSYSRDVEPTPTWIPSFRLQLDARKVLTLGQIVAQMSHEWANIRHANYLLPFIRRPGKDLRRYR